MKKTLFVLYKNLPSAYDAAQDLEHNGFKPGNVSFFTSDNRAGSKTTSDVSIADGSNFGALIGALTGLLLVLGFMVIPGTRSIPVVNPLPAVIGGVIGAGVGVLAGAFIGGVTAAAIHAALSANRSKGDAQRIHPGNALLTVSLPVEGIDEASAILVRYHPIDIRYSNTVGQRVNESHADRPRHYAAR